MRRNPAHEAFATALEANVPVQLRPAFADLRDELLAVSDADHPSGVAAQAAAAISWAIAQFAAVGVLNEKAATFNVRLLNATSQAERQAAILDLAARLGADPRQLERDAKAFDRFFDADAVIERHRRRIGERERALAYGLDRSGDLVVAGLSGGEIDPAAPLLSGYLAELMVRARSWRGDSRIRQAAHRCLRKVAEAGGPRLAGFWVDIAVRDTRRVALNPEEDAWSQVDAIASLIELSLVSLTAVFERRLHPLADQSSPLARDNRLFLRRQLAFLLAKGLDRHPGFAIWLQRLANDSDGAVRQALGFALPHMPGETAAGFFAKLRVDRDPQVRAALMDEPAIMAALVGAETYLAYLERVLTRDEDEFVLRLAIAAAQDFTAWRIEHDPAAGMAAALRLRQALTGLRARSETARVRRWAGLAREKIWLQADPPARTIAQELLRTLDGLREGKSRYVRNLPGDLGQDHATVGRVLAVLATHDFGFDYIPGRRPLLRRGDVFKRRWWRILFELRSSSTDKRQAWLHTIGRDYAGSIQAPPVHMAELAPTKVPGEPLHLSSDGGWRNFVPLLDQVLSVIDRGGEVRIFTSEGVTLLSAPRGLWRRIRAFARISWRFGSLAELRNQSGNEFVTALRTEGVEISLTPHPDPAGPGTSEEPDPQVTRLFSAGAAIPSLIAFSEGAFAYFATVYENSLFQLGVFIGLAGGGFALRHIWRGRQIRGLRDGIALVLGGWGTRGKSGTERLKAGLINALGLPLVSKTTGCEAMFLHGRSFGDLQEMFLFRPYDKATIWEQFDLVRTARGLGARVFLWECMGLTPSYVRVLQKDWMRDNISTITNTYPDHEDVQGPAGRNIPEVMTQFIPDHSLLLTTEEEMLPILRQGAQLSHTRIRPVGWKQAGLIHQSLLDRFPYAEHPFNIALVTAMADELGLGPDYAVKEMADRVVADLGVLKIYPHATIDGRTLEFVMGMSANERFGAMGNWQRMGFEAHDLGVDPQIYISTVVNNRADRVPRSRVFARILVEDIAADRHVLIGSNIDGLLGFIEESWGEYSNKINIYSGEVAPVEAFTVQARRQRVALSAEQVAGRLAAMLAPQSAKIDAADALAAAEAGRLEQALDQAGIEHAGDIASHYTGIKSAMQEYEALRTRIAGGGNEAQLNGEVREFLRVRFMAKLVPVRELYTPGEDIIRLIARQTPPGLVNRIMGMQNIKGTGLDFVYRWQAWESCYKACQQARDNDPGIARRGLDLLGAFQEYGALSDAKVRLTIAALKAETGRGAEPGDAQLDAIIARLDAQMASLSRESGNEGGASAGAGGGRLGDLIEAFLDSTDAVRRRRAADKIYRDLIEEQISSQRAALELKKLTARQKGGWLGPGIHSLSEGIRALAPWRSGQ